MIQLTNTSSPYHITVVRSYENHSIWIGMDSFDCRANQINYSSDSIRMVSFMTLKTMPVQPATITAAAAAAGVIRNASQWVKWKWKWKWSTHEQKQKKERKKINFKPNKRLSMRLFFKTTWTISVVVFCKHCLLSNIAILETGFVYRFRFFSHIVVRTCNDKKWYEKKNEGKVLKNKKRVFATFFLQNSVFCIGSSG